MRHLDLFSGIGGFALAASWVWPEHEIVAFCDNNLFCQKILRKHWPDVPIISDIRDVTYERAVSIDLLTGGFPCQPFSVAGKQGSKEDDRYLWPEMLRVIRELRPTWIIGENVAGIINLALNEVLSDLEDSEYEVQPFLIPACAVDAPHRRDRVWIVAHSNSKRCENTLERQDTVRQPKRGNQQAERWGTKQDVADTSRAGIKEMCGREKSTANWLPEPNVGRVAHGVPNRVDRLKSLGNAIVPQVAQQIMEAIKAIDVTI